MSLLHTGGTEYEEEHTGIRKDTDSQPSVQRHCIPHAVLRERESLIPVQRSDRKPLSECGSPEDRHVGKRNLDGNEK